MPIASIYGRFAYIYHQNQQKVGKYAIHGSHGIETALTRWESRLLVWTFGEDGHENDATVFEWRGMMAHDRSDLATRIVTLVCLRWFFTSYHSKSRLNHHLGCIFQTTLSKYKFTIYLPSGMSFLDGWSLLTKYFAKDKFSVWNVGVPCFEDRL